jgi:glycosyltransferase involved in cell wall biosynthesis
MLFFIHNKSIKFDTRVKYLQKYFSKIYGHHEYIQITQSEKSMMINLLQQNIKWFVVLIKSKFRKSEEVIAYLPDIISVIKALPYVVFGGKFIYDIHDYEHDRAPNGKKMNITYLARIALQRYAIKKSCALLTVSKLMRRYLCVYYGADPLKTFVIYNSFFESNCDCNFSDCVSNFLSNKHAIRIGVVGMKSVSRGSSELIDSLILDLVNNNTITGKVELVWIGTKERSNIKTYRHSQSANLTIETTEIPLLCQCCLSKAVTGCDLLIHCYKPNFSNARHAVPNKLFTYLNNAQGQVIFSGDLECKKLISNSDKKHQFNWVSSNKLWVDTLNIISKLVFYSLQIGGGSKKYMLEQSISQSFEEYNNKEMIKMKESLNVP